MLADYVQYDSALGLDWYEADPNLRLVLDRLLPDVDDRKFAEEQVAAYGPLVGRRIGPRAEITDKHGPVLDRYDRWGVDTGRVLHNSTWTDNKADLVRAGFVGLPAHAGRPVPAVVTAALSYLVSQAETAIYCGLGMSSAAADIVERYAPPSVRDRLYGRLTSLDPDVARSRGMFLTERQGGSDVGANTTRAVRDVYKRQNQGRSEEVTAMLPPRCDTSAGRTEPPATRPVHRRERPRLLVPPDHRCVGAEGAAMRRQLHQRRGRW